MIIVLTEFGIFQDERKISTTENRMIRGVAAVSREEPDSRVVFGTCSCTSLRKRGKEKMKSNHKLFATVLTAVMAIALLLPVQAFATSGGTADAVAKINDTTYTTLADAVENVESGETITLLKDAAGDGIIVPENSEFTIDFGGHTYTVTGNLAGSTGYKSQAFQLLKESTLTFKNGTISIDHANASMVIQNYSNLTLTGITLDGTKMTRSGAYVLSNNCGTVTLGEGTVINAKDGQIAMDTCKFANYQPPKVTVSGATINGTVEVSGGDLALESGKLNGEISMIDGSENSSVTKAEGFDSAAPSGYGWMMKDGEVTLHKHVMTKTEKKEATCTEAGNVEYYTCSVCGKNFSDEAGTQELDEVKVEAAIHNVGEDGVCTRCGKKFVVKETYDAAEAAKKAAEESQAAAEAAQKKAIAERDEAAKKLVAAEEQAKKNGTDTDNAEVESLKKQLAIKTIQASQVKKVKVKPGKKKATIRWESLGEGYTYKVYVKPAKAKKWKSYKTTTNKIVVKKLRKGLKYKVRVCGYKTIDNTRYHGYYSKIVTSKKIK